MPPGGAAGRRAANIVGARLIGGLRRSSPEDAAVFFWAQRRWPLVNIPPYKKRRMEPGVGRPSSDPSRCHRENEKSVYGQTPRQRYGREQTEKNATNKFEKSNYLNVLGFKAPSLTSRGGRPDRSAAEALPLA